MVFLATLTSLFSLVNPFAIDVENTDYSAIQNQLRSLEIETVVDALYGEADSPLAPWETFYFRCSRGKQLTLVSDKTPSTHLKKIGDGGDRCIVCYVSLDREYPLLLETIPTALEDLGFNGYIYYRLGGFPNPTGKEIKYAGVPYSFKIFTILEAHQLGFTNLLWIDSSMLPLANPAPLFEIIEASGALFFEETQERHLYYIFPRTRELLKELTGTDVWAVPSVRAIALGLNMDHPLTPKFLEKYTEMVELGWPFVSAYPEEFVFSSILYHELFKPWRQNVSGGSFKWEELEKRYDRGFSYGPLWFACHYHPSPEETPPAFFYFRPHG